MWLFHLTNKAKMLLTKSTDVNVNVKSIFDDFYKYMHNTD